MKRYSLTIFLTLATVILAFGAFRRQTEAHKDEARNHNVPISTYNNFELAQR